MKSYTCPRCAAPGVSLKDKSLAALWQVIYCKQCRARLCAQPWLMALAYFLYTWVIAWFGFMAFYEHSLVPLVYLVTICAVLFVLIVKWMPLAVMRAKRR